MIVNLDGSPFTLPDSERAEAAVHALEWDEDVSLGILQSDPQSLIGLVQAVFNVLYSPGELSQQQLVGHFSSLVEDIEELAEDNDLASGDDEEDDA